MGKITDNIHVYGLKNIKLPCGLTLIMHPCDLLYEAFMLNLIMWLSANNTQ